MQVPIVYAKSVLPTSNTYDVIPVAIKGNHVSNNDNVLVVVAQEVLAVYCIGIDTIHNSRNIAPALVSPAWRSTDNT